MSTVGSLGVVWKFTVGTVLTAVVDVLDISWPEQKAETVDSTAHDSSNGYREFIKTGVFEIGEHTVKVGWDVDEATHAAILTALTTTTAVACSIEDANSDETMAYNAHIVGVNRVTPISGRFEADITVRPTGAPTIT